MGRGGRGRRAGKGTCALAHARAAQESVPWVLTFSPYPGLLGPPSRSPRALPGPHLFQRDLQPLRPWRPRKGIWARVPAGLGPRGRGGGAGRNLGLLGEGVVSLPPTGWGAWGGGWAGAEASGSRVCRCAAEWNRWLGRGEGTWREEEGCGGRRMRNQEFRRPESPRRGPLPISSQKEGGAAPVFLRSASASGLRQTLPRHRPPRGRPLFPEPLLPPNPALARPRGRGLWELPRLCG